MREYRSSAYPFIGTTDAKRQKNIMRATVHRDQSWERDNMYAGADLARLTETTTRNPLADELRPGPRFDNLPRRTR